MIYLSELKHLISEMKLDQEFTIQDIIDIKEENIVDCDIEDSVIIEMIKNDHSETYDFDNENEDEIIKEYSLF